MFNRKKAAPPIDTLIGEHSTFTGNIQSDGSVKILGRLNGDLDAKGDVYIESGAQVKGKISALNAYVSGTVAGDVTVKNILHLQSKARVTGDIQVSGLVTDEGAVFQGTCRMAEEVGNGKSPKARP